MSSIEQKFAKLGTDHAPGQEVRQGGDASDTPLRGEPLPGVPVDFSHGDVNETAFGPDARRARRVRRRCASRRTAGLHRISRRRGAARSPGRETGDVHRAPGLVARELIITPGTQGALFLAIGATVTAGDRVAIVRPDYFANRKLVEFLGAEIVPVRIDYLGHTDRAGSISISSKTSSSPASGRSCFPTRTIPPA